MPEPPALVNENHPLANVIGAYKEDAAFKDLVHRLEERRRIELEEDAVK